tara:strand:- start:260 stop:550 length:291 start_codon:yes stop_codon:yes gene_type:complete
LEIWTDAPSRPVAGEGGESKNPLVSRRDKTITEEMKMNEKERDLIVQALMESKSVIETLNHGNCLKSVLDAINLMAQESFKARQGKKGAFKLVEEE